MRLPAILAVAALALLAASAHAETLCAAREALLRRLAAEYQEAPVAIGLTGTGDVVELLTSAAGSWTLLVTAPRGPTCLMGSGEAWTPVTRMPPEEKS